MTTGVELDLPLRLDRDADESLQWQLIAQLRAAIFDGRLGSGSRLPATRTLAATLGVSRNVVVAAYDELFAEGYITGRHGSGTYVEAGLPATPRAIVAAPAGERRWLSGMVPVVRQAMTDGQDTADTISFRPGVPALELLPTEVWRRIWRTATDALPANRYADPAGDPALREALARWVGRTRGVACGPDDIVITTGAAQALDLLARAAIVPGTAVAFEEPGYYSGRNILLAHGARIVPIPVDADGLCVDALPNGSAAPPLVCVTPSHQYPLGGRLPVARRLALLEWAQTHDSLIIEDDYDSEFRFDAPPLPALLSLDRAGHVAYIGTFAKSLTPTLRIGYIIAPPPLRARVVALKGIVDRHTSWPVQRAVLALLADGHLERHIRRARRHYAESRAILRAALAPVIDVPNPPAQLLGLDAGLHACLELATPYVAAQVAARAGARGVIVGTLDAYYHGVPTREGLMLGYGGLTHEQIRRGGTLLAAAISEAGRR
jgi:GntR family transcriptional regulator/MocR family aminotransferase